MEDKIIPSESQDCERKIHGVEAAEVENKI